MTHRVTIAGHTWTLFTPPPRVLALLEILRNSDRMVWPLAYALMVGAIATLDRVWGGRRTGWLLLGMLGLQAVDVGPQLVKIHELVAAAPAAVPQPLSDPFWTAAARRYARVRAVPGENLGEGWADIARFAALAGLPTDAIYMARVDSAAEAALQAKMAAILTSGTFELDTLYVLRDEASLAMARASHVAGRDLILQADGYWVLAPWWCEHNAVPVVPPGRGARADARISAAGRHVMRPPIATVKKWIWTVTAGPSVWKEYRTRSCGYRASARSGSRHLLAGRTLGGIWKEQRDGRTRTARRPRNSAKRPKSSVSGSRASATKARLQPRCWTKTACWRAANGSGGSGAGRAHGRGDVPRGGAEPSHELRSASQSASPNRCGHPAHHATA